MILDIQVNNFIEINSLSDLYLPGKLEETGTTKLNKSKIARNLNVDRRTVDKYVKGYHKKTTGNKKNKLDTLDKDNTHPYHCMFLHKFHYYIEPVNYFV